VFSFLRQLTTWHCPHSAAQHHCCGTATAHRQPPAVQQQSGDISGLAGPQQQTRHNSMWWPDGTDRQTDGWTSDSYIGPATHIIIIIILFNRTQSTVKIKASVNYN